MITPEQVARNKVKYWLEGVKSREFRPTLAEVQASGYEVVPANRRIVDAVALGQILGVKAVTVRKWHALLLDDFPPGQRVGAGDRSEQSKKATSVWEWYEGAPVERWAVKTGRWPIQKEEA